MSDMLPTSPHLNIASLSRLFDNKSECYKLFWFQAILRFVCEQGRRDMTFHELIDSMIADAWYMVTEYHLNLGPRDTLERVVRHIHDTTGMLSSTRRDDLLAWLRECSDPMVIRCKRDLTLHVPFRLQAPFLSSFREEDWKCGSRELASRINAQDRLMYYFEGFAGLSTRIRVEEQWRQYMLENQEILRGWLQYDMIIYLQRRNPSVPGISDKLCPPQERKLERVKRYWRVLAEAAPIREIYGGSVISPSDISIDHFVPWSYVAHDEFWNLHPTTRAINSSKSNHLPEWDVYFPRLADLEYQSYRMIWTSEQIHSEFDKCAREHLNNPDIATRLYRQGLSAEEFRGQLRDVIYPVFASARACGIGGWVGTCPPPSTSPDSKRTGSCQFFVSTAKTPAGPTSTWSTWCTPASKSWKTCQSSDNLANRPAIASSPRAPLKKDSTRSRPRRHQITTATADAANSAPKISGCRPSAVAAANAPKHTRQIPSGHREQTVPLTFAHSPGMPC